MAEVILCKICGQRRAKRACPAVQGDICPLCCGTQREVTLSCPLECVYLREGHKHEKPIILTSENDPAAGFDIGEDFLRRHEELFLFCIFSLVQATLRTPGAVDSDLREALEALIQTQRTAESGLVYETRPENTVAASIQRSFSASLADYEKEPEPTELLARRTTADALPVLILLLRLARINNNGRPKGRMFIDMLSQMTPSVGVDERAPSIIL